MKKLFIIAVLLLTAFTTTAQESVEPKIDTVTINFEVISISSNKAKIVTSRYGKKYEVPVTPEYNPFGYVLEVDREYTICLERDMNEVYEFQTR